MSFPFVVMDCASYVFYDSTSWFRLPFHLQPDAWRSRIHVISKVNLGRNTSTDVVTLATLKVSMRVIPLHLQPTRWSHFGSQLPSLIVFFTLVLEPTEF